MQNTKIEKTGNLETLSCIWGLNKLLIHFKGILYQLIFVLLYKNVPNQSIDVGVSWSFQKSHFEDSS